MKYTLQNLLADFDERFLFKSNVAGDPAIEYVNQPNIIQDTEPIKQFLTEKITKLVTEAIDEYKEALIWCSASEDFQIEGKARKGWEKICIPLLKRQQILSVLSEK